MLQYRLEEHSWISALFVLLGTVVRASLGFAERPGLRNQAFTCSLGRCL